MSGKIFLTEHTPYVTCSANLILLEMYGFCERFITPSGARPYLPAECMFVLLLQLSSSKIWVEALRNYSSLLTKGGVREDKRYGEVVQ